jgi:hypothetical protein
LHFGNIKDSRQSAKITYPLFDILFVSLCSVIAGAVGCTDGQLRRSNIMAENAIRPFAVGRRAWLFADTPAGADASAVHYSLIQTAKLHGLELYAYLNAVFKALPYADTVEDIEALLPWNFKSKVAVI